MVVPRQESYCHPGEGRGLVISMDRMPGQARHGGISNLYKEK